MLISISLSLCSQDSKNSILLKAALGFDKPPYVFGKTSSKGIEPDLLREAMWNSGYRVDIRQMPRNYLKSIFNQNNSIDIVATTSNKNTQFFYSNPFVTYENYVITRNNDHLKIDSIDDLATINFVSWKDSYYDLGDKFYNLFNPITGKKRRFYHDNISQKENIELFFSGRADAIIMDKTTFEWYKIFFNNQEEYVFHDIFKKKEECFLAFKSEKIRDDFNRGLKRLKDSGRYDEIVKFYNTEDIERLLTFSTLIGRVSSKYIFKQDIMKLKNILRFFFLHPDIVSISIEDTSGNSILNLIKKDGKIVQKFDPNREYLPQLNKKIYYDKDGDILPVGRLKIRYKSNFKSARGMLIPILNSFKFFSKDDFNYIKNIYKDMQIYKTSTIFLTEKEKKYLLKHKTITVHNEVVWAPYNFNENGIPKGFCIDYMDMLAKKLHINIKYINGYSWAEFLNLIKIEKIDVIANIVKTKQRAKYINFTSAYIYSKKAIFSNTIDASSLRDLKGKTVAVPEKFYIEEYLKKNYPSIRVKTYKNTQDCLFALVNREADALIENYAVVNYLIKKNGLSVKYVNISNSSKLVSHIRIGVRKSQTILKNILQKAQNSISIDKFEKLENKWFGLSNQVVPTFTQKEQEYLKKKKSIRICTNPNWAPIEFMEDGKPKGITIDIINLVAKKLNLKIDFIPTSSWGESQKFLKEKRCDILASSTKTKEREEYAKFTRAYMNYDLVVVTKNDKPMVNELKVIVDKTMARKSSSGISMLLKEKYPDLKIYDTTDMLDAFKAVQKGDAYFTISTLPVFSYNRKIDNIDNLQIAGYSNIKLKLRVAVRDDDKTLLSAIDKALRFIPKDTLNIINEKWTTQEVIKKVDYTFAIVILVVSLIIITITVFAYLKQQKLKRNIELLNNSLEERVKKEVEKNREQQLLMLQQSRLAQMGEIISMIAHQWRQPLNNLSLLNQTIVMKYRMKKLNDHIIESFELNSEKLIERMSKTINDFRDFFRPEKRVVDFCLNSVIIDAIDMVKPIFDKQKVKVTIHADEKLYAKGYPNEFGQALLNIINNAKDVLSQHNIENGEVKVELYRVSSEAILTICDNGGGVPNEIIDKIFDPYFSTKEKQEGTGLGLYMTKIIIEEHLGGKIDVQNISNGAKFTIKLGVE